MTNPKFTRPTEYRRLTGGILAQTHVGETMPLPLAVLLIVEHADRLMACEPDPAKLRPFLVEIASILLMVEGFYEVVDGETAEGANCHYGLVENIRDSMKTVVDRFETVGSIKSTIAAAKAKKASKLN